MTMLALHRRPKKIAAMPFMGFSNVDDVIKAFADPERIRKMVFADGKEIRLSVNTKAGQRDLVPGDWIMRDAEGYLHKLTAAEVDRDYVVGGFYVEASDEPLSMVPSDLVRQIELMRPGAIEIVPDRAQGRSELVHGTGEARSFQPGTGIRAQMAARDDGNSDPSRLPALLDDLEREAKARAAREAATGEKDPETIRAAELERILSKTGELTEEEEAFLDSFDRSDRQATEAATARQTEAPLQPGSKDQRADGQGPAPQV